MTAPRRTLAAEGSAATEARRSRFLAAARPLAAEDGLRVWLDEVAAQHPGARHVVYGWRGAAGERRSSDGGEPAGTGGRPCLAAIEALDLVDTAVAVARFYGGTPLGAANLARAYHEAAAAALAEAGVRVLHSKRAFTTQVAFTDAAAVERALRAMGADGITHEATAAGLTLRGSIPAAAAELLAQALAAVTGGRAQVRLAKEVRWL